MTDGRQSPPGPAEPRAARGAAVPSPTLNRLSFYRRCLQTLQAEGVGRTSSGDLARRFDLSAAQIRKDLNQLGEFGIRGVGYHVDHLLDRLSDLLGLSHLHRMILVGMGNLGMALSCYFGFNSGPFRVVAGIDNDLAKVGQTICGFTIRHTEDLADVVRETEAEIGILCVPADAAQATYEALVDAGVSGVINFSPTRLRARPDVPLKDVDLRIYLEELAFFLPKPKC